MSLSEALQVTVSGAGHQTIVLSHGSEINDQYGHLTGDSVFKVCAKRLMQAIAATPIPIDETLISSTISIGLVFCTMGGEALKNLIKRADANLYKAKRAGRNQVDCST